MQKILAPSKMVMFADGQWRKLACDCLALYTLEQHTGRTAEEFFDQAAPHRTAALGVAEQISDLLAPDPLILAAPLTPAVTHVLQDAAGLLQALSDVGAARPRRLTDWYDLCWSMTAGFREDNSCPLDYRRFLRVIPTGPAFQQLVADMIRLYVEHVRGVNQAVALGNDSASGQQMTGGATSPPVMTGPGASGSPPDLWDEASANSGAEASPDSIS